MSHMKAACQSPRVHWKFDAHCKVYCYYAVLAFSSIFGRCCSSLSLVVGGVLHVTCPTRLPCPRRVPCPTTFVGGKPHNIKCAVSTRVRGRQRRVYMEGQKGYRTLVVIGGGAAGFFGAIQAASSAGRDRLKVVVLEAGRKSLSKVKISGGGRCNVMHDTTKPVSLIVQGYPRGRKQLIGPFNALFGPTDAARWFELRGVALKTEADGRMFPTTDDSQTVIDCLEGAAGEAGVEVITSARVTSLGRRGEGDSDRRWTEDGDAGESSRSSRAFEIFFTTLTPLPSVVREVLSAEEVDAWTGAGTAMVSASVGKRTNAGEVDGDEGSKVTYRAACDYVLQATGASREGHGWAQSLGHEISNPIPSLFTLTIKDPRLEGLAGLSVQDAELRLTPSIQDLSAPRLATDKPPGRSHGSGGQGAVVPSNDARPAKRRGGGKKQAALYQRGPVLITHTGLSGPAVLKISAFGARELSMGGYKARLAVNWVGGVNQGGMLDELQRFRVRHPRKTVHAVCPVGVNGAGPESNERDGAESHPGESPEDQRRLPLPRRLWQSLALEAGVGSGEKWGEISKAKLATLARELTSCELQVVGKGAFREEFVTCGGVALSGVDMHTMESRHVPGLFFAGEVIDIDGITGGFNFQSAWTTAWVAGSALGAKAAGAAGGAGAISVVLDDRT